MAVWFTVAKRETCPRCDGLGYKVLFEEAVVMPNGGISQPARPESEWPVCRECKGNGYTETQVDLREALREIMQEAIDADNR
jgi:hypothetical protein